MNAALPDVFHFYINVGREFAFEGRKLLLEFARPDRPSLCTVTILSEGDTWQI